MAWLAGSAACTEALATHLAAAGVTSANAIAIAALPLAWLGGWARLAGHGIVRAVGTVALVVVLVAWLVGAIHAHGWLVAATEVGCAVLATLLVLVTMRERLFGVRGVHALYRARPARIPGGGGQRPLYIGITNCLAARFAQHAAQKPWWAEVALIEVEYYPTRAALEAAERAAIRRERPVHNHQHNRRR